MTTTSKKYYALVSSNFSYSGRAYWLELHEVKNRRAAQLYVDLNLGGLTDAEIAVSINDGYKRIVSKKNEQGKWKAVYKRKNASDKYANDQTKYNLNGELVSKEDFYKYGFLHDNQREPVRTSKLQQNNK